MLFRSTFEYRIQSPAPYRLATPQLRAGGSRDYARALRRHGGAALSAIGDPSRCSGASQGAAPIARQRDPSLTRRVRRANSSGPMVRASRVRHPARRTAERAASAASRERKSPNTAEPLPDMAA